MKELNTFDKLSEIQDIELTENKKQEIEYKWVDNIRPLKGHRLFEINMETYEINEAEYTSNDTVDLINPKSNKEVVLKKNHAYISALNAKSAMKRFKQNKGSATLPQRQNIDFLS